MPQSTAHLLLLAFVFLRFCGSLHQLAAAENQLQAVEYTAIDNAFLCIATAFTESRREVFSSSGCALMCNWQPKCQAFTMVNGFCQLFVFEKCTKSVLSSCSCATRGRVFVRQQLGLTPGSLCPQGYGNNYCGAKYRIYQSNFDWNAAKAKCESEPGLTIMADMDNVEEKDHLVAIHKSNSVSGTSFVSGYRARNSSEKYANWIWRNCGANISSTVWHGKEPNGGTDEPFAGIFGDGLCDIPRNYLGAALCECVSPFD